MPTITILESSPRAANWLHIFGRLTDIPIRSPFPIRVHVPDHQNALAYLLDVSLITNEERLRLVNHLAKYFSLTHAEVERDLDSDGVPILADDVIVSIPQGIALSMINDPFDLDEEIDWQDDHCGYDGEKETDILTDKKTPKTDKARVWIKSNTNKDFQELEAWCHAYANDFSLNDQSWISFDDILKKVPIKTYDKEEFLKNNRNIETTDSVNIYLISIKDFQIKEDVSPLSFVKDDIKALIINKRKLALIQEMQKNAMEQALKNKEYEIY